VTRARDMGTRSVSVVVSVTVPPSAAPCVLPPPHASELKREQHDEERADEESGEHVLRHIVVGFAA